MLQSIISHKKTSKKNLEVLIQAMEVYKIKSVDKKLDLFSLTISVIIFLFTGVSFAATRVRIENARNASATESVPSAESLRPLNGNTSGLRWHWLLIFTRQTWFTSWSIKPAITCESDPKILTC